MRTAQGLIRKPPIATASQAGPLLTWRNVYHTAICGVNKNPAASLSALRCPRSMKGLPEGRFCCSLFGFIHNRVLRQCLTTVVNQVCKIRLVYFKLKRVFLR